MISKYLKIAFRSLKRHKLYSFINVGGLSISLAIAILLCLFVIRELSFDNMFSNRKDIYRVLAHTNKFGTWCHVPDAVAPAIKKHIPEVKYAARMLKHGFGTTAFITADNQNFSETNFYWCDNDFFHVFDIPFVKGNPATALTRPNTVVLSSSVAQKYFGDEDPLGKTITVDNDKKLEVTGVYKDLPDNSTLDCNIIASFNSTNFYKHPKWGNASFETYCLLNDHADIPAVEKKMQEVMSEEVPQKQSQWFTMSLQPLSRVHLYSYDYTHSYSSHIGDIKDIRNLSLLALLILLIACINYMNLATARFQKKAEEVAINKTLGASMPQLVSRFYIETAILTLFAMIFGLLIAVFSIPVFNSVTGESLSILNALQLKFAGYLGLIWLIVTLLAGSYPAIYLSRFSPRALMQRNVHKGSSSAVIRKGLVILQFVSSIALIVAVLVIYQQLKYVHNKDLGYNPENVIAISTAGVDNQGNTGTFINELKNQSDVLATATVQGFPGMGVSGRSLHKNDADNVGLYIQTNRSGNGMIKVLGLHLLAGHDLPATKASGDSTVQVILNKKAINYLGYTPEQAIGKKVLLQLGNDAKIVGVVNDFNFASLHQPLGAYAFHNSPTETKNYILVRFKTGNLTQTIAGFRRLFKEIIPNAVFDYTFLDKYLNTLYAADERIAKIILIFSILAVVVASLGLFGLTTYMAEQRTKEIGVRKILGASVGSVVTLLSKDFLKLVGFGFVIAIPVAWYAMHEWLQNFAYHIDIGAGIFAVAGVVAILIALATVSWQSVKAAIANPVESLRNE